MKNLEDLFKKQLIKLHSIEEQMIEALPKMIDKAKDEELKQALSDHLSETKNQKSRLEEIFTDLDLNLKDKKCKSMEAMISEAEKNIKDAVDEDLKHVGIIADAQNMEHYEISGYGTAVRFAKELGHSTIAHKLQTTLDEEHEADQKLNRIAENRLNRKAK